MSQILSQVVRTSVLSISENKGQPRLWLEGRYLEKAGFNPNTVFTVNFLNDRIEIKQTPFGDRHVSFKKNLIPVIDINNSKILRIFAIADKVKVITKIGEILVTKTKLQIRKLTQVHDQSVGEVFCGGGLLSQAAKEAGFKPKWGIEYNEDYAEVWQANHNGTMFNCDVADVDLEELSKVELLIGGIPCEPFSVVRRNQGKGIPEEHKNADLSMFFLMIVERVNPRTIILEEVPSYIKSGIGTATISALKRMGYKVDYRLFTGLDYGELETRKRVVIVATTDDEIVFPELSPRERVMGEILDNSDPECEWFDAKTKSWIFKHWKNQNGKGNYFTKKYVNLVDETSTKINTIPKRYRAIQGSNPLVKHPTLPDTFRLLTLSELRKLKGLDEKYQFPVSKTTMGEIINQGVIVPIFRKIIESVCGSIK